ncbi:mucin-4 [Grus japonensis]|uniref:Mucin-4 n=1 Tax=Grus japonensis TaxID=30415 RepID=A0ABC9X7F1_GRUJA
MVLVLPAVMVLVLPAVMALVLPAVMVLVLPAVMVLVLPAVMALVLPAVMASVLPAVMALVLPAVMALVLPAVMAVVLPAVMALVLPAVMAVVLPAVMALVLPAVMVLVLPAVMALVLPAVMVLVLPAVMALVLPAVMAAVLPAVMAVVLPAVMALVLPAAMVLVLPAVMALVLPAAMALVLPAVMTVVLPAAMAAVLPAVMAMVLPAVMAVVLPAAMALVLPAVMAVLSPQAGAPRNVWVLRGDMLTACPTAWLVPAVGEVAPVASSVGVRPAAGCPAIPTPTVDKGAVAGSSAGLCGLGRGESGTMVAELGPRTSQDLAVVSMEGVRAAGDRTGCLPPPASLCVTAGDRALLVLVAFAEADGTAAVVSVSMKVSPPAEVAGRMVLLGDTLAAGTVAGLVPAVLETGTWVLLMVAGGAAPSAPLSEGVASAQVVEPPTPDQDAAVVSHACVWPTVSEESPPEGSSSGMEDATTAGWVFLGTGGDMLTAGSVLL